MIYILYWIRTPLRTEAENILNFQFWKKKNGECIQIEYVRVYFIVFFASLWMAPKWWQCWFHSNKGWFILYKSLSFLQQNGIYSIKFLPKSQHWVGSYHVFKSLAWSYKKVFYEKVFIKKLWTSDHAGGTVIHKIHYLLQ